MPFPPAVAGPALDPLFGVNAPAQGRIWPDGIIQVCNSGSVGGGGGAVMWPRQAPHKGSTIVAIVSGNFTGFTLTTGANGLGVGKWTALASTPKGNIFVGTVTGTPTSARLQVNTASPWFAVVFEVDPSVSGGLLGLNAPLSVTATSSTLSVPWSLPVGSLIFAFVQCNGAGAAIQSPPSSPWVLYDQTGNSGWSELAGQDIAVLQVTPGMTSIPAATWSKPGAARTWFIAAAALLPGPVPKGGAQFLPNTLGPAAVGPTFFSSFVAPNLKLNVTLTGTGTTGSTGNSTVAVADQLSGYGHAFSRGSATLSLPAHLSGYGRSSSRGSATAGATQHLIGFGRGGSIGLALITAPVPPMPITPIVLTRQQIPAVKWDWVIAQPIFSAGVFQGFSNLGPLNTAQGRSISLALNGIESASFVIDVLDDIAEQVWLKTLINCLVCYRDGEIMWSGPLWTTKPVLADTNHKITATAVGWYQYLLGRLLKCGTNGVNPMVGPTSTTSGNLHSYVAVDPTAIAVDLIERTAYEYPLPISIGNIEPNPNGILWNVTYQQLQNIGQAIQTLSNVEGGFDFRVDPSTLAFNIYYGLVKNGSTIYGRGQDRPNACFTFPGNLVSLSPTEDASVVETQDTVIDQLSNLAQFPAPGQVTDSISTFGMWQHTDSLSDITSLTITTAFAEAEVLFLEQPQIIWSFVPRARRVIADVPEPFVDYDIGDFIYLSANYGVIHVPPVGYNIAGPMPVRMFAFTLNINAEGVETLSNVETVFGKSN